MRIVVVDYNHLVHRYLMGGAPRLSHTVSIRGVPTLVDTTIPTYTIKAMTRWAEKGKNILAVCFDSPCSWRKQYFSNKGTEKGAGYKDGRTSLSGAAFEGMAVTISLLHSAGVSVYKQENCEADDLVYSVVMAAKKAYPDVPIDIIGNDADLLPLVDDQVSYFFRSVKMTWAENKYLEKKGYMQVTPDNYQEVSESLTAYKKTCVPYNTILLHKLLRGDSSDKVSGHPDYKPKMYNSLIGLMMDDRVNFRDIFTYGDNDRLNAICTTLGTYIEDADLDHVRFIFNGINLKRLNVKIPEPFDLIRLQKEVSLLNINLGV